MELVRQGYVPVTGGRIWYQVVGRRDSVPLLLLHGGPGAPHDYLEPLAAHPSVAPTLRLNTEVLSISRRAHDKLKDEGRADAAFVLRVRCPGGSRAGQ